MYMCAAEKVAEEKFSGEPSARGEGSESLESLKSLEVQKRVQNPAKLTVVSCHMSVTLVTDHRPAETESVSGTCQSPTAWRIPGT